MCGFQCKCTPQADEFKHKYVLAGLAYLHITLD